MKKICFLLITLLLYLTSFTSLSHAQGEVILDLYPEEEQTIIIGVKEQVETIIEVGKFFDKNYPDSSINKDLTKDIVKFYPSLKGQDLFDRQRTIRDGIKFYRYFNKLIKEVKEKFATPEHPVLIVEDDEYDIYSTHEYVDVGDDNTLVISDFKKIISYSSNPEEFKATRAKVEKDNAQKRPADGFERLGRMLSQLEIKKLLLYGLKYEDPFVGEKGSGNWINLEDISLRLIAAQSAIDNQSFIKAGLHFKLPVNHAVLAYKKDAHKKIKIELDKKENVKSHKIYMPSPTRNVDIYGDDVIGYTGDFIIPIFIEIEDGTKPLFISADVEFSVCNDLECKKYTAKPELSLETGYAAPSTYDAFIEMSYNNLPQDTNPNFDIIAAAVEDNNILRVLFSLNEKPSSFEAFIESRDDITFLRPKISINNNLVIARFEPVSNLTSLDDREFIITAALNKKNVIRKGITAEKITVFDYLQNKLSWGFILIAIAGGFILNFMPCVFPVLSLKLISLSKAKQNQSINLRKDFLITTLGIFTGFFLIALCLTVLRLMGQNIGWGMQFQSPYFLVGMIFVICFFMAQVWGVVDVLKPRAETKKQTRLAFFSGGFIVLMSTPCTAPYLGTAIGFALSNEIKDIFIILMSIALGLSLPYLIVSIIPGSSKYFPKPGSWMTKLNKIMSLLLVATFLWLLAILFAQTSLWLALRVLFYSLAFLGFLWFIQETISQAKDNEFTDEIKEKTIKILKSFRLAITIVLIATAMIDAGYHFYKAQTIRLADKEKKIDAAFIAENIGKGRAVLISIEADWCLTCGYNNIAALNSGIIRDMIRRQKLILLRVDWTNYDSEILEFMERYGRKGLPFYILFSPQIPEGIVLPEILDEGYLLNIFS